jgi:hypothetical protein
MTFKLSHRCHCGFLHSSVRYLSLLQIPTFGFLYVAGYIGHVGRQYLIQSRSAAKPTEKEIIIDVPLALKLAFQGWAWPLATVQVRNRISTTDSTIEQQPCRTV